MDNDNMVVCSKCGSDKLYVNKQGYRYGKKTAIGAAGGALTGGAAGAMTGTVAGGSIGMLLGMVGGPLGMLVGGAIGATGGGITGGAAGGMAGLTAGGALGSINSDQIILTCLNCGESWEAGNPEDKEAEKSREFDIHRLIDENSRIQKEKLKIQIEKCEEELKSLTRAKVDSRIHPMIYNTRISDAKNRLNELRQKLENS